MKKYYRAFNMTIESDIDLPMRAVDMDGRIDLSIKWIDDAASEVRSFYFGPSEMMMPVEGVGDFCMSNGSKIEIYRTNQTSEATLAQFILNSCLMVIFQQRGLYPVHGMAVAINESEALIVAGTPHAGKSTLGQTFIDAGYTILSDDLTPVNVDETPLKVYMGHRMQRFWTDSIEHFGISKNRISELYEAEGKCAVYMEASDAHVSDAGYTIKGIIELSTEDVDQPVLEVVPVKDAIALMIEHTYRKEIYEIPQLLKPHFIRAGKIVQQVPIYRLKRPVIGQTSDDQMMLLIRRFKND